jgi:hypothetical protein
MLDTKHYTELSNLIDKFNTERNSLDLKGLQTLREDIALTFFYIADFSARCIANFDAKDYDRKRFYSIKETEYRSQIDETTNKKYTIADVERMARMEAKDYDDATVDALRQKEKMRIINIATQQILNSLSSRIQQFSK